MKFKLQAVEARDYVSLEPFQRAFHEKNLTLAIVCRRLGWMWNGKPDTTRLARTLGFRKEYESSLGLKKRVQYKTAVKLAEALEMDPWEAGI